MFESIINKAKELINNNEELELVEIIKSDGATPRKAGAFMFVDKNAKSFGTIGGGNVEFQVTKYAASLLSEKKDGLKEYNLSQEAKENIGMVCGGDNEFKFTYLKNDDKTKEILEELSKKNRNKITVYIFGAGHVSMELAKNLIYTGFDYVVWDDREDFANEERFPNAKKVICKPYDNVLDEVNITDADFVVVMTRGHVYDYMVEKQILKTKAYYIGVIGSENKNKVIKEKLTADGYGNNDLNRVCAPIGIQIAAETPEEIAVSILSELILFRSCLENRVKLKKAEKVIDLYKEKGLKC